MGTAEWGFLMSTGITKRRPTAIRARGGVTTTERKAVTGTSRVRGSCPGRSDPVACIGAPVKESAAALPLLDEAAPAATITTATAIPLRIHFRTSPSLL